MHTCSPVYFEDIHCKSRSLQKGMHAPINYTYYKCALTNFQMHQI